jgi:uncharacterized protein with HEPN domain
MRPETEKLLHDIRSACRKILRFTDGKCLDDYSDDDLLRSGVERQFEIIGEALNAVLKLDPEIAGLITDPQRIVSFRNLLIHGYSEVNDKVEWGIVEKGLPLLYREVETLLGNQ